MSVCIATSVKALSKCEIGLYAAFNQYSAFDKVKYLEPVFGNFGQALNERPRYA